MCQCPVFATPRELVHILAIQRPLRDFEIETHPLRRNSQFSLLARDLILP